MIDAMIKTPGSRLSQYRNIVIFEKRNIRDRISGRVAGASRLVASPDSQATFQGSGSYVVFDWGRSPLKLDDSCQPARLQNWDRIQTFHVPRATGLLTQTVGQQRGGFRFLTIVSASADPLTISNISLAITFMPHWDDLRAYPGYFFAPDPGFHDIDCLTKIWHYRVQTNTIPPHTARQEPCPAGGGWSNDALGGAATGPILVDGAKRDRNIWPGDCGISTHTELVALSDMEPTKNSLMVMFRTQNLTTGALQYSGPPLNNQGSDTYISWSLIGTHNYFLYTGDLDFIKSVWANYTKAVGFLEGQVDLTGLMNVSSALSNDWGRASGAGHNSAANALLYRVRIDFCLSHHVSALIKLVDARHHGGPGDASRQCLPPRHIPRQRDQDQNCVQQPAVGRRGGPVPQQRPAEEHPPAGRQRARGPVQPHDIGRTEQGRERRADEVLDAHQAVASRCVLRWWFVVCVSPARQIQAHFVAGKGERAIDLIEREWGYMLETNLSVKSPLLEGFSANGSLGCVSYQSAAASCQAAAPQMILEVSHQNLLSSAAPGLVQTFKLTDEERMAVLTAEINQLRTRAQAKRAMEVANQPEVPERTIPPAVARNPVVPPVPIETVPPATAPAAPVAPPQPPIHPYAAARDGAYAPPKERNVGIPAQKSQPPRSSAPIYNPKDAAAVFDAILDIPVTQTLRQTLSIAPEVRAQFREATSFRRPPAKTGEAVPQFLHPVTDSTPYDLPYAQDDSDLVEKPDVAPRRLGGPR
ncbi:unnamed protein product [Mycena citricolor]|uniref:Uncharacterized protein n=1 Tax=Mycena citricolor TaxID=2018698 RepID=A0AAD2HWV5_9AGAR|nr:unnamed protein product [Mycena citricolor]